MLDSCTIRTDPLRLADATLDPVTLELTDVDASVQVYSGKCFVSRSGRGADARGPDGERRAREQYGLHIPFDAPTLHKGQTVTMTTAVDAGLQGKVLVITETELATLYVWRSASMELVESDRDA
jgi:hypothetical protein